MSSRSSKSDAKRDWYIWRPPQRDASGNPRPPNNWRSVFQGNSFLIHIGPFNIYIIYIHSTILGSAWEYDERTEEYYLHLYVSKQPDLNWENPDVREAAWDVMRFWIERGCDGFRVS